ncbi:MAG: hypothetical protein ACI8TX_000522 [Hyphomicrobiaceae bacterium]|jgi:hypothetical protein
MKESTQKVWILDDDQPVPVADDGAIDEVLLELDVKLAAWTRSMLTAEADLKDRVQRNGSPGFTTLVGSQDEQPKVPSIARIEPAQNASSATTPLSAGAARLAALRSAGPARTPAADDDGSQWRPAEDNAAAAASPEARPVVEEVSADFEAERGLNGAKAGAKVGAKVTIETDWSQGETKTAQGSSPRETKSNGSDPGWSNEPQWPTDKPDESPQSGPEWTPAASDGGKSSSQGAPAESRTAAIEKQLRERVVTAGAEDEQRLKTLDANVASRVRKLRRLDPYADIEELIERVREAQPETETEKTARSKGSWWRRS